LNIINAISVHDEPIRSLKAFNIDSNNICQYLATASKDMTVKCWIVEKDNKIEKPIETKKRKKMNNMMDTDDDTTSISFSMKQVGVLNGHSNSVESLEYWKEKGILLSGDWNGNVMGWNAAVMETNTNTNKQKNGNNNEIISDLKPMFTLRAHVQSVSDMYCNDNYLFTCSWDHSLKQWDMEKQDCINTYAGSKVMTSLHVSPIERNFIATSHPDGRIRVWDQRLNSESGTVASFGSKDAKDWISQVN
jgi:WD40 repeat protein